MIIPKSSPEKRKPTDEKKESAVEKSKNHKAMTHNARRRAGGGNLAKGCVKMPRDLEEMKAFDFEFPSEKREHGSMISFQGQTLVWNQFKQDF